MSKCSDQDTADWEQIQQMARQDSVGKTIEGLNGFVVNTLIPQIREKFIPETERNKVEIGLARLPGKPSWEGFGWMPGYVRVSDHNYAGEPVVTPLLPERRAIVRFADVSYEFTVASPEIALKEILIRLAVVDKRPSTGSLSILRESQVIYNMEDKTFKSAELVSLLQEMCNVPSDAPLVRRFGPVDPTATQAAATEGLTQGANAWADHAAKKETTAKLAADGLSFITTNFSIRREEGERRIDSFLRQWYARFEKHPTMEDLIKHILRTIHREDDRLETDEEIQAKQRP